MRPLVLVEDAAARRWVAERALRTPLLAAKFGAPLLVIAAVGVLVYQRRVGIEATFAARAAFVLAFALPFLLVASYPALRWWPQRWTIDGDGIAGSGRRRGRFRWSEVRWWGSAPLARAPTCVCVQFASGTGREQRLIRMVVPASARAEVEAWFATAAAGAERRELPQVR